MGQSAQFGQRTRNRGVGRLRHRLLALATASVLIGSGFAVPAQALDGADAPPTQGAPTVATPSPTLDTAQQPADPSTDPGAVTEPTTEPSPAVSTDAPTAPEPKPEPTPDPQATEVPAPADSPASPEEPAAPTPAPSSQASRPAAAALAAEIVPVAGQAVLRVRSGGLWTPGSNANPGAALAGVTVAAVASSATSAPALSDYAASTLSCVTDAQGVCDILVSSGSRYWVAPVSAPAGWSVLERASFEREASSAVNYGFRTASLNSMQVVNVPAAAERPGAQDSTHLASVAENPAMPGTCDALNLTLVFDTSDSMTSSRMTELKNAANAFLGTGGLGGTPTRVSMFSFGETAQTQVSGPFDLSIPQQAAQASQRVNALPSSGTGGTNWDSAMRRAVLQTQATGAPGSSNTDLVIFITDGDPTRAVSGSGGTLGSGSSPIQPSYVEKAIFGANTLKVSGTRIVPIGVGMTAGGEANVRAISGPQLGTDYFKSSNFDALTQGLRELAAQACGGTVTVKKQVLGDDGTALADQSAAAGWAFTAAGAGVTAPATKSTGAAGTVNFDIDFTDSQAPKTITITEEQQPGWSYVPSPTCVGGAVTGSVQHGFQVTVAPGAIVTCTVQNTQAPTSTLQVNKVWTVNGEALPLNTHPTFASAPGLSITGAGDAPGVWGETRTGLVPGSTVTVSETPVALPSECRAEAPTIRIGSGATRALPGDGDRFELAARANVATITNAVSCDAAALVQLDKTVSSTEQLADGRWKIVYDIAVTNPSEITAASYDLTDELRFGAGVTIDEANVTAPAGVTTHSDWDGAGHSTIATAVTLAAEQNHHYTVTVIATVPGAVFAGEALACDPDGGPGGFGNRATLTAGDTDPITADACSQPERPDLTKTAEAPVPNGDGTTTVSYLLTVTGGESLPLRYSLADTPETLPTGIAFAPNGEWSATAVSGTPTLTPGWNGTGTGELVADGTIAAGETISIRVSATVLVTARATETALNCEASGGIRNRAELISGLLILPAPAVCVSLPTPGATLSKTVDSVSQAADGSWTVTYTVTATNTATDTPSPYTLEDTLDFGPGISIIDASATGVDAGATADLLTGWNGRTTTALAAGTLPVDGVRAFIVVVTATVGDAVFSDDAPRCDAEGGFLNTATLVSGGSETEASACADPERPEMTKVAEAPVTHADGSTTVSYLLTVTGGETQDLGYALADTPEALPTGVRFVSDGWSAQATAGTPDLLTTWDGREHTELVRSGIVPAGTTVTVRVSATLAVDTSAGENGLSCEAGGGIRNGATLLSGPLTFSSPIACVSLPLPGASVTKTLESLTQDADGAWTVRYTVTARNTAAETASPYTLEDRLAFGDGITVTEATATGADAEASGDLNADWDGRTKTALAAGTLPVDGARAFSVTVRATVAAGVIGSEAASCDAAGGFLNTATIRSGGTEDTAEACANPERPSIEKTAVTKTVIPGKNGEATLGYTITVRGGTVPMHYSLSDQPAGFPAAVFALEDWMVSGPGTDEARVMVPGEAFATDVELGAGQTHEYRVSVLVRVAPGAAPGPLICEADGSGVWNTAELVSGGDTLTASDCITVVPPKRTVPPGEPTDPTDPTDPVTPKDPTDPTDVPKGTPPVRQSLAHTGAADTGALWAVGLVAAGLLLTGATLGSRRVRATRAAAASE